MLFFVVSGCSFFFGTGTLNEIIFIFSPTRFAFSQRSCKKWIGRAWKRRTGTTFLLKDLLIRTKMESEKTVSAIRRTSMSLCVVDPWPCWFFFLKDGLVLLDYIVFCPFRGRGGGFGERVEGYLRSKGPGEFFSFLNVASVSRKLPGTKTIFHPRNRCSPPRNFPFRGIVENSTERSEWRFKSI